jgi:bifunctional DNase/RNase
VRIVRLTNHTFYAEAVLDGGTKLDARPSDAITLAALTGASIRVSAAVLEQVQAEGRSVANQRLDEEAADADAGVIVAELSARLQAEAARLAGL